MSRDVSDGLSLKDYIQTMETKTKKVWRVQYRKIGVSRWATPSYRGTSEHFDSREEAQAMYDLRKSDPYHDGYELRIISVKVKTWIPYDS